MSEFRTIVASTLRTNNNVNETETAERLMNALWNLNDMEMLTPLIAAMKMEEEEAPKHFYAWKGLLYYVIPAEPIQRFQRLAHVLAPIGRDQFLATYRR